MSRSISRLFMVMAVMIASGWLSGAVDTARAKADSWLLVADFSTDDGSAMGDLRELHLLTLADVSRPVVGATPASLPVPVTPGGDFVYRERVDSADGAVTITIDWPRGDQIKRVVTVRAGIVGPVINQFEVPGSLGKAIPLGLPGATFLSADGRRLVLVSEDTTGTPPNGGGVVWSIYDPMDGRRIAGVRSPAIGSLAVTSGFVSLATIDPAGQRLYRIAPVGAPANPEMFSVQLVAHDLATGAEAGRLDLPDLQVGERNPSTAAATLPADTMLWPGFAISPDRREGAIVHPDGTSILLIDTTTLTIARSISTSAPLAEPAAASPATLLLPPSVPVSNFAPPMPPAEPICSLRGTQFAVLPTAAARCGRSIYNEST